MKRSQSAYSRYRNYLLSSGALILAAGILATSANAEDFVIDQPVNQTNGGNPIDDDDTLTVEATGAINTQGDNVDGVNAGSRNTITNFGIIGTESADAVGIRVLNRNTVINAGSITSGSDGILAGNGNAITNSGSITSRFVGIRANDGNTIINSGSIATGIGFDGIVALNENEIIHSGSIRTTGALGDGIVVFGEDNKITSSGLVVSAGGNAFDLNGANNELNLLAPSFIGGTIDLGTDTTVNITTGASHSVLWDFSTGTLAGGVPNVTGAVASFFNADTKQFATLDPTGFAASFDSLGDMTGLLSNVGRQGLSGRFGSQYGAAYGMKDAGGDPALAHGQSVWVTPFGGKTRHAGDDATLERDITQGGLALGYRWQYQPDLGLGVMAGYISDESEASSRFAKSHESEADGFFAAMSGRKQWGSLFLDVALMGGFMSHGQDRFVNDNLAPLGVSFANASFDSRFISPEAGLSMSFDAGNGLSITPGARMRYAAQWLDGYTEDGSSANATVDDRMLGLLEASAEIAVTQRLAFGSITGRLGILGRMSTGDDDVIVSLIDVTNNVAFGTGDDFAGYVGLGASIDADDNLKLQLDGQAVFGTDFTGVQGLARIVHSF